MFEWFVWKTRARAYGWLQAKIDDPSTSGMQKAKATNELAQIKSEDPLPLRRAKITQEAALRKAQKQKKVADAATAAAEEKKAALEEAERALQQTAAELEQKEADLAQKKADGKSPLCLILLLLLLLLVACYA